VPRVILDFYFKNVRLQNTDDTCFANKKQTHTKRLIALYGFKLKYIYDVGRKGVYNGAIHYIDTSCIVVKSCMRRVKLVFWIGVSVAETIVK